MSIKNVLEKLTKKDKIAILQHLIILPTIEDDHMLSKEELGNILIAGEKMGFTKGEIMVQVHMKAEEVVAVIETEEKNYLK